MLHSRTNAVPRVVPSRFLTGILVVAASATLVAAQGDGGTWISRAVLPTPRQEMPHVVLDGKVYVIGGLDRVPTGSTLVEVFDPSTNSWETKAEMPFPLHHHGVAAINGKLYVLGGYQRNTFNSTTHLFEYDPASDTWTTLDPMPTSRGAHAVGVLDGKIYVTGGVSFGVVLATVEVYDPVAMTWSVASPMNAMREHHTAAVVDSLLYVAGGRIPGFGNVSSVESYNPATNTWTTRRSMPTARSGLTSAAYNSRMFVFGGEIPGVYSENEMYDPATNSWTTMTPMPTARHGIGAAVVGDTIFVIGGAPNQGLGLTDVNQGYVPPASIVASDISEEELPDQQMHVDIYPNPASVSATATVRSAPAGQITMSLVDVLGRHVRQHRVTTAGSSITEWQIQTSGLTPGLYFLTVFSDQSVTTRSLLVTATR